MNNRRVTRRVTHRKQPNRRNRRRGGAIGSDLAVGTATVGIPLAIYAIKKLYDKITERKRGGLVIALRRPYGRSRFRPMF
jgi:hypothetical protein